LFIALYDVKELPFSTNNHNNTDWHHWILPLCTVIFLQIDSEYRQRPLRLRHWIR